MSTGATKAVPASTIVYGAIQLSPTVQLKGMFTPVGPHKDVLYVSKSFVYFGPFVNNCFEGDAVYSDFEQLFTYVGSFRLNVKEGFGLLLQYTKSTFEYKPAEQVTSAIEFASYSTAMQQLMGTQLATWKSRWEKLKSTLSGAEELIADFASGKTRLGEYAPALDLCGKMRYEELKKLQPSRTAYCYIGELKGDMREGFGISFMKTGDIYIGKYAKNKRTGFGIYLWNEKSEESKPASRIYVGYYTNNATAKFSAVLQSSGDFYLGQIANSTFGGKGEYISELFKYRGEFKQGKRAGHGRLVDLRDAYSYEGNFESDTFFGMGAQSWEAGGIKYLGEFRDGAKAGKGEISGPDGEHFEGDMKDGTLNGHGIMKNAKGIVYEGAFAQGKLNGKGRVRFPNGAECVCEFVDGLRKGEGVVTLPPEKGFKRGESRALTFDFDVATNI